MKSGKLPPVSRLMEALQYEPLTGVFTWVLPPKKATRVRAGDIAGCFDGRYVNITLDGVRLAAHRVALAMTTGVWPEAPNIDHRDGDGGNNRLANLREATRSLNQQNQRRPQRSNRTGFLGVVPVPSRRSPRRFRAQVFVEGKPRNLGYYLTAEEAHGVYLKAKRELHEGCLL